MHTFTFTLPLFALFVPSFGAIYLKPSQLPRLVYDYVIVGAGNAGNVLANRLTENPNVHVLVLEAGVSDEGVLGAIAPFLGPSLTPNTPFDWNYTVAHQAGLNNRVFPFPRGKLLGGCTSVNYMVHQYGSTEDFDKLAADTGDTGWSWSNMKKFIFVHERIVPPVDGHNTSGQFIPANHGTDGELPVSLPGNSQEIDARVIATTQEMASEFPFNPDMGGGDVLGFGWVQSSIGGGVRSSSSTTYLRKANSRPNLSVLINAQVMKLLPTSIKNDRLVFGGVMFGDPTQAVPVPSIVFATKEIILSAGSFGTPQILLLSGIGPRSDLTALGIPTIVDNASVGKNLSDHVFLSNIFKVQGNQTLDNILRGSSAFTAALNQWNTSRTGVIANGLTNNLGFFRLPSNATIFRDVRDPATGPKASHFEMIYVNFWINPGVTIPSTGSFLTAATALISPTSRGFVKLSSSDPFDKPIIDPKYLSTPFDIFCLREAVKAAKRSVSGSAWANYIIGPFGDLAGNTDTQIEAYVRSNANSVYHPIGTSSMTAYNASWGVVNPDLKLKGAEGIRIVDASVFPTLPNAHTQGPTYLLAERAAVIIKADQ